MLAILFLPRNNTVFFCKKRDFDTGFHLETPLLSNKLAKNRKFVKLFETKPDETESLTNI